MSPPSNKLLFKNKFRHLDEIDFANIGLFRAGQRPICPHCRIVPRSAVLVLSHRLRRPLQHRLAFGVGNFCQRFARLRDLRRHIGQPELTCRDGLLG